MAAHWRDFLGLQVGQARVGPQMRHDGIDCLRVCLQDVDLRQADGPFAQSRDATIGLERVAISCGVTRFSKMFALFARLEPSKPAFCDST